jgi:peptidoglycan hydrolase-like protein with peptidoglycan-binding domain
MNNTVRLFLLILLVSGLQACSSTPQNSSYSNQGYTNNSVYLEKQSDYKRRKQGANTYTKQKNYEEQIKRRDLGSALLGSYVRGDVSVDSGSLKEVKRSIQNTYTYAKQQNSEKKIKHRDLGSALLGSYVRGDVSIDSGSLKDGRSVKNNNIIPISNTKILKAARKPDFATEKKAWVEVKDSNDPEMLQEYLIEYPHGLYSKLANLKLKTIKKRQISKAKAAKPAKSHRSSYTNARKPDSATEKKAWLKVKDSNDPEMLQEYLNEYPRGLYSKLAKIKLKKIKKKQNADTSSITKIWSYKPDTLADPTIKAIQKKLAELGFNIGTPNGIAGKSTKIAIRTYQELKGVPVDGKATKAFLALLNKPEEHIQPKSPKEYVKPVKASNTRGSRYSRLLEAQKEAAEINSQEGPHCGTASLNVQNSTMVISFRNGDKGSRSDDLFAKISGTHIQQGDKSVVNLAFQGVRYFECIKKNMKRYTKLFTNVKWSNPPKKTKRTNSLLLTLIDYKINKNGLEKREHIVKGNRNGQKFILQLTH